MKIISSNKKFERLLLKLINKYDNIYISVAWASAKTEVFNLLIKNIKKLKSTTIGTHFYQTDPDFLDAFIDSDSVRFITQPNGTFHPKVYFFCSAGEWEAIIGSANMTAGAMKNNEEISIHISSSDNGDVSVKEDILERIKYYFQNASSVSNEDAQAYRRIWAKQNRKLDRLSGAYGKAPSSKSPIKSKIMCMDWGKYSSLVQKDPYHGIEKRLELLNSIRNEFNKYGEYKDMPIGVRKTVAGLPNNQYENWAWFGSMKGAGVFHSNINNNNEFISDALQNIGLNQNISKSDYLNFIECFIKAFPNGRHGIGTASRLLAMKRPDIFVCIDDKNKKEMCNDFGITVSGMSYERYWDELICRIQDSVWWQSEAPEKRIEHSIWKGRAALLDCIFYDEEA